MIIGRRWVRLVIIKCSGLLLLQLLLLRSRRRSVVARLIRVMGAVAVRLSMRWRVTAIVVPARFVRRRSISTRMSSSAASMCRITRVAVMRTMRCCIIVSHQGMSRQGRVDRIVDQVMMRRIGVVAIGMGRRRRRGAVLTFGRGGSGGGLHACLAEK